MDIPQLSRPFFKKLNEHCAFGAVKVPYAELLVFIYAAISSLADEDPIQAEIRSIQYAVHR